MGEGLAANSSALAATSNVAEVYLKTTQLEGQRVEDSSHFFKKMGFFFFFLALLSHFFFHKETDSNNLFFLCLLLHISECKRQWKSLHDLVPRLFV